MTRGKIFKSTSDRLGSFQFMIWHVVKILIQNLTRCDFLVRILTQCTLFFFQSIAFKKAQGGKVSPFGGTKWAPWTFESNFFRKKTFFEVFNLNTDSFWISSKKIWHIVKLWKNLTGGGKLSQKLTFISFLT